MSRFKHHGVVVRFREETCSKFLRRFAKSCGFTSKQQLDHKRLNIKTEKSKQYKTVVECAALASQYVQRF